MSACSGNVAPVADLSPSNDAPAVPNDGPGTDGKKTDAGQTDAKGIDDQSVDQPCTVTEGCDDQLECTVDNCSGESCDNSLKDGFCLIAGHCYVDGNESPNDSCRNCNATLNPNGWSDKDAGDSCNDGQDCTYDDVCTAGSCAGTTYSCPADSIACTTETCNGLGPYPFGCDYPIQSGKCLIEGKCQQDKEQDTSIACRACRSDMATESWSPFASPSCVMTFAGIPGGGGAINGAAHLATFNFPVQALANGKGDVIVVDRNNERIRLISNGKVSNFAGSGTKGFLDGPQLAALFDNPEGAAVDSNGALYIADENNNRIRKIANGYVTTIAGNGNCGHNDGAAVASETCHPRSVAVDSVGIVYFSDSANPRIRMVYNGIVSTLAGSGTTGHKDGYSSDAQFSAAVAMIVDATGKVYVAEPNRIRTIYAGQVETFAGTGDKSNIDGPISTAAFANIRGMAIDSTGTMYVSDSTAHGIRMIKNGVVSTLAAGNGHLDGGLDVADFYQPRGLSLGANGALYIADAGNDVIRVLFPPAN